MYKISCIESWLWLLSDCKGSDQIRCISKLDKEIGWQVVPYEALIPFSQSFSLFNETCDYFWLKIFLVQNSLSKDVSHDLCSFLTPLVGNKCLLHLIERFYLKMHLAACTSCNKLLSVIRLQNVRGSKKNQQLWWLFVLVMFYKFTTNTESGSI